MDVKLFGSVLTGRWHQSSAVAGDRDQQVKGIGCIHKEKAKGVPSMC